MKITLFLLSLFTVMVFSSSNPDGKLGRKIAFEKNKDYIFITDTIALKAGFEDLIAMPNIKLDKIEVLKDKTIGDRQEDYYMVVAYDFSESLTVARWLVKKDNGLYYYKNNTGEETDDTVFFRTYYACYGSKTNCFPKVAHLNDGYTWGGNSTKLVCDPDDPCKAMRIFEPEGE
jgi:hypothetical protein